MKDNELLKDYFTGFTDVINQLRSYGDELSDRRKGQKWTNVRLFHGLEGKEIEAFHFE